MLPLNTYSFQARIEGNGGAIEFTVTVRQPDYERAIAEARRNAGLIAVSHGMGLKSINPKTAHIE